MANEAGKGSRPRPYSISQVKAIFGDRLEELDIKAVVCPVCSDAMYTQENWKFFYCNNADCNGMIHKG